MIRMTVLSVATVLGLAGCGADGEPVQPSMNVAVGVGSSGVNTYGGVGLQQGPLSVYLGF
ncbi:hypothetical protein ACFMPD_16855 [Sedimentitalea sp. HM32M-2]|uniref:hypothetical protein n=1 Tax=Sedimentitalea sp. HM32M-2 TaxID=3351566 RepID=UPI003628D35B